MYLFLDSGLCTTRAASCIRIAKWQSGLRDLCRAMLILTSDYEYECPLCMVRLSGEYLEQVLPLEKNLQITGLTVVNTQSGDEWVWHEWWVIWEASSQVVKHVQPVIQLHILVWSENMIWSLPTFSPFRPSLPGTPPSPGDPCKVWWKETHLSLGLHLLSHTHTPAHTHLSPSPPHSFIGLPCFNIIFLSQDLWNASLPSLLLSKDRCSLPKQVCRTDWVSASVPGIKRSDLPLSTN